MSDLAKQDLVTLMAQECFGESIVTLQVVKCHGSCRRPLAEIKACFWQTLLCLKAEFCASCGREVVSLI